MTIQKEVRVQFLRPDQLLRERNLLPLIIMPLAPLEWHGPHLPLGTDPLIAENAAIMLAREVGGVVLPTLFAGTERERPPETLKSLGFSEDDYVVGMDFPTIEHIYNSYYYPEELFALMVRAQIEKCIAHKYRYIYIVNGHGAVNHNEVLKRLCVEINHNQGKAIIAYGTAFPEKPKPTDAIGHAGCGETSLMMYYTEDCVDLSALPPLPKPLKYSDHAIVDDGGFTGNPGPGYTVSDSEDPRKHSSVSMGKRMAELTLQHLVKDLRRKFGDMIDVD